MITIVINNMSELAEAVDKLPMRREPNDSEKELVAALRSGRYKQTIGVLRRDDAYCCLGVACDVYNPNLWDEDYRFLYMDTAYALPDKVQEALGWKDNAGSLWFLVQCPNSYNHLTHLNDKGASFDTIATIIEKGYVVLKND